MLYTVDYFIKKFEAIPEELWEVGAQYFEGRRCALGYCDMNKKWGASGHETKEGKALIDLFYSNGLMPKNGTLRPACVTYINNGEHPDYEQPTPKQRILAALYDIKAKQQPEIKEHIVYVAMDSEAKELKEKLMIN